MTLDVIALVFSGIAVVVSIASYFGARQIKRRDWRIDAAGKLDQSKAILEGIPPRASQLKKNYKALAIALRSAGNSGHKQIENDIDTQANKAADLLKEISIKSADLKSLSDADLENKIVELNQKFVLAREISMWFDQSESEHAKRLEAHQRQ
ncbi:MAG: hypothetical protein AAF496_08045 [Pseudomonadota bacterium]